MAFGAFKMKPKLNKLQRPEDWPPPPEEEPTITLGELKAGWSGMSMPPCKPPKTEKYWSYEVLSEPAHHITSKLNFYKERKRLRNIVSMTATDTNVIILLEVYNW